VKSEVWIERLTVENLGPFVGRRTFNFGTSPEDQLTYISGSSGSGKTYLVNALCWMFDLPAPAISRRLTSPVIEYDHHFSVEVDLQVNGVVSSIKRDSLRSEEFVAPQVSIIHFDDLWVSTAFEKVLSRDSGHASGKHLLYSLTKFLDNLKNRGDFRPIVFDAPFGYLDMRSLSEAFDALISHSAQIIFCGNTHDCRDLIDRGCSMRVLEI